MSHEGASRRRFAEAIALCLAAGLVLAAATARADGPAFLVRDVNTGSDPRRGTAGENARPLGAGAFFTTRDGNAWRLWRSDGTAAGTLSFRTLAAPGRGPLALRDFHGTGALVFFAEVGAAGWTLWRSDGSAAGTFPLAEFADEASCRPTSSVAAADGLLYFAADDGESGRELWRSDGSAAGTVRLADLDAGPGSSDPFGFAAADGVVFFVATVGDALQLWKFDGATASAVHSFPAGMIVSPQLTAVGANVFFTVFDVSTPAVLWVSDGSSAGTRPVGEGISIAPRELTAAGAVLVYSAWDFEHGRELWRSDGSDAGTHRLGDLVEGPQSAFFDGVVVCGCDTPCDRSFFADDGIAYFATAGGAIWRSDGTPAGTLLLREFGDLRVDFAAAGEFVLLGLAPRSGDGLELPRLWRTDGTAAGTSALGDVSLGANAALGSDLLFFGDDGRHGVEPWRSDGMPEGTTLVADLTAPGSSAPANLVAVGSRLAFFADDGARGRELWMTNAAGDGAEIVVDLRPGAEGSVARCDGACPAASIAVGERLYFFADDGVGGLQLWRSDLAAGTEPATTDLPATASPLALAVAGGRVLHFVYDPGVEPPFRSQLRVVGETGQSVLLHAWSDVPSGPIALGERVYFGVSGQLWQSDGTLAGTKAVALFSSLDAMVLGRGALHLSARGLGGEAFSGLWRFDLAAGPLPLVSTTDQFRPRLLAANDDHLYFPIDFGFHHELWRSDGTLEGTWQASDVNPGQRARPTHLTPVDAGIYFTAESNGVVERSGRELWFADGTRLGARLVHDVNPGPAGSLIAEVGRVGGDLLFGADDGAVGNELWLALGGRGTALLDEIAPGTAGSNPAEFVRAGGHVYFSADDGAHGRELWAVPVAAWSAGCPGDCGEGGRVTVEEIVRAAGVSLEVHSIDLCAPADVDGDVALSAAEIRRSIVSALRGC